MTLLITKLSTIPKCNVVRGGIAKSRANALGIWGDYKIWLPIMLAV